jgi:glycosyltransferase involved in cell wall biosynthesis
MTVVEAMSCARALVVTDCGALPHLVHEQGGIRVPAGDPEALAQALVHLLRNPEKRVEMGRYNRRQVEEKMSWDKVAQQLEVIYEIVLSERAALSSRDLSHAALGRSSGPHDQEQVVEL